MNNDLGIKNKKKEYLKKVSFWSLFNIFKWKAFRHFIITVIASSLAVFCGYTLERFTTIGYGSDSLNNAGYSTHSHSSSDECCENKISSDYSEKKKDKFEGDYSIFFPQKLFEFRFSQFLKTQIEDKFEIKTRVLERNEFFLILIFLFILSSLIEYYNSIWETDLHLLSSLLLKNKILDKFRNLDFEKKIDKKDEVKLLYESDVEIVSSSWWHLNNHLFHNFYEILAILYLKFSYIKQIGLYSVIFSAFWLILINFFNLMFQKVLTSKNLLHKDHLVKETSIIHNELSRSILIESMGLSSEMNSLQKKVSRENDKIEREIIDISCVRGSYSSFFIESYLPFAFILKGFDNPSNINHNNESKFLKDNLPGFLIFWDIYHKVSSIIKCFKKYPSYNVSCSRLNDFIDLPEKEENLDKDKINQKNIKEIVFSNVDFKYSSEEKLLFKNYNRVFSSEEINNLSGKNGTGKSTLIYLLLGMLKPLNGNIFVNLLNGRKLDLNKDINLKNWKEDIVAFCSHDNLIDEGSTGQRQIKNIKEVINKKRNAKIFVFDEANNALDADKQKFLLKKIEKMVKNQKIVVYVKH